MPLFNNILAGAAGQGGADAGYKIERSLRFDSSSTSYLSRTPSSAGNRKTWTWSGWVKLCKNKGQVLFHSYSAQSDTGAFFIDYLSSGILRVLGWSTTWRSTSAVFRDFSAWQHVVVAVDTTNATANDRIKVYVNGSQITDFSTLNNPSQNAELAINQAAVHHIGNYTSGGGNLHDYLDGYLADIHFIDGQQLAATDFGRLDENNSWQPKQFAGTYGPLVDQSQTWSNGVSATRSGNPATNGFDGDDTSVANAPTSTPLTITFSGGLTVNSKLEGTGLAPNILINEGRSDESSVTVGAGYQTIFSGSTTIYTLKLSYPNNSASGCFNLLKVDGKILVDSGVSVTDNSFRLDFSDNSSNAALGTDSSGGSSNTWTVNNLTAENPRTFPGVDFDASGDHIESADHADYSLGTNDFTMECYIYPRFFTDYKALMMKYTGTRSTSSWWWSLNSSGHILFYVYYGSSEVGIVTSGTGMTLNKWNHVACVRDGSTTRVYINGVQCGSANIGTNSLNDSSTVVRIARDSQGYYDLNGIMSNVRLVNGTCLYPNGTTFTVPSTPLTNVTNTKLLCCQSSSSATAATVSPNTLTTGGDPFATERSDSTSANDSLLDSPTNYDDETNVGGNYCTFNALDKRSTVTLSNGNLDATTSTSHWSGVKGTLGVSSGKYYFEVSYGTGGNDGRLFAGICSSDVKIDPSGYIQDDTTERAKGMLLFCDDGQYQLDAASRTSMTSQPVSGDVIGVAFDLDANTAQFYRNGAALGSIDISSSGLASTTVVPLVVVYQSGINHTLNAGQRPFAYPVSGFKSLCTQSLDDPLIADPSTAMDIDLYTGTGSTHERSNFSFNPDLVWIKNRSSTYQNLLFDSVRGATKYLKSDATSAEQSNSNVLTSFDDDGFTLGNDNEINKSSETYCAWAWDAGTSNTSISAGSLNSTLYDQSQTWTNQISGTENSTYPFSNLFNGDNMATHAYPANGTEAVFTPNPSFSNATTVKIWYYAPSMGADGVKLNGTSVGNQLATTSGTLTKTFDVTGTGFTSLAWSKGTNSTDSGLLRIDVDGKQLVDNGVSLANVPSIASTTRANPTTGISVVTFTGNGNAQSVAHSLSAAPEFILLKNRDTTQAWYTYQKPLGANKYMNLNTGDAAQSDPGMWNNVEPTSNVFTVGTYALSNDYSAIAFAPVEGFSKFGLYSGNGDASGPFIFTGFKPRWLMVKSSSNSGEHWLILDTARDPHNLSEATIYANLSNSEYDAAALGIDILSNGFKLRGTNAGANASGYTYFYAAFASSPYKYARAR